MIVRSENAFKESQDGTFPGNRLRALLAVKFSSARANLYLSARWSEQVSLTLGA